MRCSNCGSDNPAGKKFCSECGARFSRGCPQCGAENAPAAKFCGDCGAELSPPVQPPVAEASPVQRREVAGERRHLTVLFCDLVNSTHLAGQLDPEQWREIVANYHRSVAHAVERFGGHVAQYLGDGVMAYFGWPEAHDDDAERAARAGLTMLDTISKLNGEPSHPKLAARVGIDSGAVVVGAGTGKGADVFGETPNIAARVQSAAEPGTMLITDSTHRLIAGLFVVEERGAQSLKGVAQAVLLYRVVRPSGMRGRLGGVAAVRGLTPFVGREDELRLLMNRWERAVNGEGQVVLIVGEPGIGKSRLVQRFREQIAAYAHTWLECAAVPFFQNTPFYAVTDMLQQSFHWESADNADQKLAAMEASLVAAGVKLDEAVPPVARLLELPVDGKYPPSSLPAEQQRKRLLAVLVAWVLEAAKTGPLVIATEDLHWADPSTLELIRLLVEQEAISPLLLLYTARPEFHREWPLRAHHTQITLNRLSPRDVREMIAQVTARDALAVDTVNEVIKRTSGVPLFVEELTRAVLESGNAKLSEREIPVTLHDSLMARLDRLGAAKEVLQIGAVIGAEFSYRLLQAVHPRRDEDLQQALHALADAELLYVRGAAPDATYQFKQALIRDAAYDALLRSRRKHLHRLIAQTISETFPALKTAQPEVLARHWAEAGETEQAIAEWSRAGKVAKARGAFKEGLESYRRGLALLELLPESSARDLRELAFRQAVLLMLWMTGGPSSHETMEAVQRAVGLAEKAGKLESLVLLMVTGGWSSVLASRDVAPILMLADQALELALRDGSPSSLLMAHSLKMQTCLLRGDLTGAENHFAATTELVDNPSISKQYSLFIVQGFYTAAMNAWMLGRLDLARERFAKVIAITDTSNPYQLAASRVWAADFLWALREYEQAEACAMQALELSEKNQFALVATMSRRVLGSSRIGLGRATEGVELIREGIAGAFEIGCAPRGFFNKTFLAAALAGEGAIDDALETIDQALEDDPDEAFFLPITLTLRGELRIRRGRTEAAEADFREALVCARNMGAKMLELQAAMSSARLLDQQQRRNEAREMLAEIYNWFTEGFDTADLKHAKALLEELSG